MFNGKIFAHAYLDNQLNLIKDQWIDEYNDRQINKMLDQLVLIYPNKSVKEIIDKLILDISDKLPLIAISLNKVFAYNQQRLFKSLMIMYKTFYYKQNERNKQNSLGIINNGLFSLIIKRMRSGLKENYFFDDYDPQTLLSAKNFHILALYILKEFKIQIRKDIYSNHILPELIIYLYKRNKYINQYNKKISVINIIIQIIITNIQNETKYFERYKSIDIERHFITLFQFIKENWNIIKIKYQTIIKVNIDNWQQLLQQVGYNNYNETQLITNDIKAF